MDSNISINPALGVYISSLIALARIRTYFEGFSEGQEFLVSKLLKQGSSKQKINKVFLKFIKKHQDVIIIYRADILEHTNRVISDNEKHR